MKLSSIKVGQRVACYSGGRRYVGVVKSIEEGAEEENILISFSETHSAWFHHKQLYRLKPKPKTVRITEEQLAKAWDSLICVMTPLDFSDESKIFPKLKKALGFK